jgi:hypothetical protein
MKTWLRVAVASAVIVSCVPAQEKFKGPPPLIAVVAEVSKERGELIVEQERSEVVPVTEKVVEKDGAKREVARTTFKPVTRKIQTKHRLADCDFQTGDGKKVTTDDALKQLSKGTVILVAPVGGLDPDYLTILKKDALILLPKGSRQPIQEAIPPPKR